MKWHDWMTAGFLAYRALKGEGSTWVDSSIYLPVTSIERRSTQAPIGYVAST